MEQSKEIWAAGLSTTNGNTEVIKLLSKFDLG